MNISILDVLIVVGVAASITSMFLALSSLIVIEEQRKRSQRIVSVKYLLVSVGCLVPVFFASQ